VKGCYDNLPFAKSGYAGSEIAPGVVTGIDDRLDIQLRERMSNESFEVLGECSGSDYVFTSSRNVKGEVEFTNGNLSKVSSSPW